MNRFLHQIQLCFLLFVLGLTEVPAVASSQVFQNYLHEQASPIMAIDQDADGLFWLGTAHGLYTFDGYRFVLHYERPDDGRIYAVVVCQDFVVMGSSHGVTVFDRRNERKVALPSPIDEEVRTIVRHGDCLYIGGKKALYALALGTWQVQVVSRELTDPLSVAVTDRGLLVGTVHGLYEYADNQCLRLDLFSSQQQSAVSALQYDKQTGRYWLGTYRGLLSFDLHTRQLIPVPQAEALVVKSLTLTPKGLFISSDDGLYRLSGGQLAHTVHDSQNPASLSSSIVWCAYADSIGNVLLGTENGLSILRNNSWGEFRNLGILTGSSVGNNLTNLHIDSSGDCWMGGTLGLIHVPSAGNPVHWFRKNDAEHPLSHNRVRAICEDSLHNLWICTDIGLDLYDRQRDQMLYRMLCDAQTHRELPWIYDLLDDGMNRLWLGSCDNGVYVIGRDKLLQTSYSCNSELHLVEGLSSKNVRQLVLGKNRKIWVRTGAGVDVVDAETFHIDSIRRAPAALLYADSQGNVWVADKEGIDIYATSDQLLQHIPFGSSLDEEKLVAMMEIEGRRWVVTSTCCAVYGDSAWLTNVRIPGITANCACFDAMNRQILIGGEDGTVCLDPQLILNRKPQDSLLLSNLLINGSQYRPEEVMLQNRKEISLKHTQNNLTFQFTDLPLRNAGVNRYAYRLRGLEQDWHYLHQTDIDVSYTSIPYGNYVLEVNAVDGIHLIGRQLYALEVCILPPWYLSSWAKIAYLLLLFVVAYGGLKLYRMRRDLHREQLARLQLVQLSPQEPAKAESAEDSQALSAQDDKLLKEINRIIEENMSNSDFNVSELQRLAGIGDKLLYRKIKLCTGMSPVEYIRDLRLKQAAQLLREGRFSISEVMYMVGFSNSGYFSKCFSKAFGTTPTNYMKGS